ncbi:MAG TPA: hypothetical protein VNQ77_03580 [Frankiaceae bacterium]|nr:hypothetical protein [Frankiaceae bacterium]
MNVLKKLLGVTAVAAVAVVAAPAPANAGVAQCALWAVGDTGVGGTVSIIPLVIAPEVRTTDVGWQVNCVLDTVGLCTYNYDPVGVHSEGLVVETQTYAECVVLPD